MDQYNDNSENEFLWKLLADPANDPKVHTFDLQRLVNDFPQSGILQALLAHASDDKNLKQASVYFSPKALYKLINTPASFIGVADEKIILQKNVINNGYHYEQHSTVIENTFSFHDPEMESITVDSENYFNETTIIELDAQLQNEFEEDNVAHEIEIEPFVVGHEAGDHLINTTAKNVVPAEEPVTAKAEALPIVDAAMSQIHPDVIAEKNELAEDTEASTIAFNDKPAEEPHPAETQHITTAETADKNIEEEVFEEIAGVEDFKLNGASETSETAAEPKDETYRPSFASNWTESATGEELSEDKEGEYSDDAEKIITESIASTDYFMFDNTLVEGQAVEQKETGPEVEKTADVPAEETVEESALHDDTEQQDVSKYHDEKMPYTFMWWLDKTRKEHASVYQPYVKAREVVKPTNTNTAKKTPDELQQQYYENIFHITSVEELDKATAPNAPADVAVFKSKEHFIIERFIQEEPQIRPQSSDKLDNENKARKSSEDRDELVTETLAGIYTDQMLYHKAIASYKKLMLKFPEKSRYFAAKIEQLEKKTN